MLGVTLSKSWERIHGNGFFQWAGRKFAAASDVWSFILQTNLIRRAGTGCYFPINEYAYNTLATDPDDQVEEL